MDDDGKPIARQKKKAIFDDEGLEAARDIFGCDFDYGEFEQYEGKLTLVLCLWSFSGSPRFQILKLTENMN